MDDPLMPAYRRFPRDQWPQPECREQPSSVRPFVLRGATIGGPVRAGKHRTPASQTLMKDPPDMTSMDNRQVPDPVYVPDD
jgi:hypothetical protein